MKIPKWNTIHKMLMPSFYPKEKAITIYTEDKFTDKAFYEILIERVLDNKVELNNHLQEFIKFQNLVEKNYHKTKKVEDYAHMMGFSAKKLNTIVNFISNKSVKAFIDEVVIIKAKKDILHTNMSAKQVAFKLGFNDPANFYKYFKKHTSYTPESFRKTEKV